MQLSIPIKKTTYLLFGIIVVLNGFGIFLRILTHIGGLDLNKELLWLFDTAEESNVTSWFSSMLLLIAATLLMVIARIKNHAGDGYVRQWNILSGIFFFLSLEEIIGIHEKLIEPLRNVTGAVGFEMLGGVFHDSSLYRIFVTVEELLENIGARLFIVSRLVYLRSNVNSGSILCVIGD